MKRPAKAVLQVLVDDKLSDTEIGNALSVSARSVQRWRALYEIPSKWEPKRAPHGTAARYQSSRCRCEECTKANTEYCRRYTGAKPRVEPAHGTITRYKSRRCRCDECRAANAAKMRAHRSRGSR